MNNLLILIAAGLFLAAISVGVFTSSENWKNVALSWVLLAVGLIPFGIALTL